MTSNPYEKDNSINLDFNDLKETGLDKLLNDISTSNSVSELKDKIMQNSIVEEKYLYSDDILKTLLYFSCTDNNSNLPRKTEMIYDSLIRGTLEHLTGQQEEYLMPGSISHEMKTALDENYDFYKDKEKIEIMYDFFHKKTEEVYQTENICLEPNIENFIMELIEPPTTVEDFIENNSKLCEYMNGNINQEGIFPIQVASVQELPNTEKKYVEDEVLPYLPDDMTLELECIGNNMRKYLNNYIEYLNENYSY